MKHINLKIVCFCIGLSIASQAMHTRINWLWYEYNYGNVKKPSSYNLIPSDPIYTGTANLGAIATRPDPNYSSRPDSISLIALFNESGGFLYPGSFEDGIVEKKDDN